MITLCPNNERIYEYKFYRPCGLDIPSNMWICQEARFIYNSMKFKFIRIFICMLLLPCVAQASIVYVSSSQGNDLHDGLNIIKPVEHISKALTIGDTIYLKAGDIFFEAVDFTGKYVTRYGKGKDPVICGFKHIETPQWIQVDENIWKINCCISGKGCPRCQWCYNCCKCSKRFNRSRSFI